MPVCTECGGGFDQSKGRGRPAKKCPECRRYGGQHQKLRRETIAAAYGTPCARCGFVMTSDQMLHLDHNDDGDGYLGWSHASCNMRAGARKGNRLRRARGGPVVNGHRLASGGISEAYGSPCACCFGVMLVGQELQLVGGEDGSRAWRHVGCEPSSPPPEYRPDPDHNGWFAYFHGSGWNSVSEQW